MGKFRQCLKSYLPMTRLAGYYSLMLLFKISYAQG